MIRTFERSGVRFRYPANWTAEAEDADGGGWAVTVQSPDTAFALVSLRPDAANAADLADETLAALAAEYKELDAETAVETVGGVAAVGHDIDFLTLDAAVACRTRCVETPTGPLLLMSQVSEYDRGKNEPVLRAVVASLEIDEE